MQAASQPVNQVAKAPPPKGGINLIEILKDYVENMLLECQGRKALILDQATLGKYFNCHLTICPSHHFYGLLTHPDPTEGSLLHRHYRQHPD